MEITICVGSSCHLKGSREVVKTLEKFISHHKLEEKISLKGSFCMGKCAKDGVCVRIGGDCFQVHPRDVESFFYGEIAKRIPEYGESGCVL